MTTVSGYGKGEFGRSAHPKGNQQDDRGFVVNVRRTVIVRSTLTMALVAGAAMVIAIPTGVSSAILSTPSNHKHADVQFGPPYSCTTSSNGSCVFPQDTTDFPGIDLGSGRPASKGIEVDQNMWNTGCSGSQTLSANSAEDYQVVANYPTSSTGAICSYPNAWPHDAQGAIDSYTQTTSSFDESFPHNAQTQAHAMYDLWFDKWAYEVMVQYDFSNDAPCEGSWPQIVTGVSFGGSDGVPQQQWHLCQGNGGKSLVWKLGASDAQEQSESSGSVDLLSMLQYLENHGYLPAGSTWTAVSMGWEIASTGGQSETFSGNGFGVTMVPTGGGTTTTTTSGSTTTTSRPTTTTTSKPTTTTTRPTTTTTRPRSTTTTTSPSHLPPPASHGYWLVGSDGGIFNFGSAGFDGSTGSLKLQRPVVGITRTRDNSGYWLVASDGGVFSFGAPFVGSIPGLGLHPAGSGLPNSLDEPIVGMVPSTDGQGYYMVAADGGVFAFNSPFAGSCPGIGGCSGAAVAVAPDASGSGYWLVTATGHVYSFGGAPYFGAPGPQSSHITSMVRTPDGGGYYILDADGRVFAYGDANSALGGLPAGAAGGLDSATAIFDTADGGGYWITTALGKVYPFGDAPSDGDMSATHLNGPIIAATGF